MGGPEYREDGSEFQRVEYSDEEDPCNLKQNIGDSRYSFRQQWIFAGSQKKHKINKIDLDTYVGKSYLSTMQNNL